MDFWVIAGRAADVAALPGLLVGFGLTWWQLLKTRGAAEVASASARQAKDSIGRQNLLVQVPLLYRVEDELNEAVRLRSSDRTLVLLISWRRQANQIRGLLQVAGSTDDVLINIQKSVALAATAQSTLNDDRDIDLMT